MFAATFVLLRGEANTRTVDTAEMALQVDNNVPYTCSSGRRTSPATRWPVVGVCIWVRARSAGAAPWVSTTSASALRAHTASRTACASLEFLSTCKGQGKGQRLGYANPNPKLVYSPLAFGLCPERPPGSGSSFVLETPSFVLEADCAPQPHRLPPPSTHSQVTTRHPTQCTLPVGVFRLWLQP